MASAITTTLQWTSGMAFNAECGEHQLLIDTKSPLGKDSGLTPKELVVIGLAGCTAMDVVALLKKYKQNITSMSVNTQVEQATETHPHIFKTANIEFQINGEVAPDKALEAVTLSQTKFCGVSAMISKTTPISYTVVVNGTLAGEGKAQFPI